MNDQNLIPTTKRTEKEARELSIKGGKRSGEVRRQRKTQREQLELLMSLPMKNAKLKSQIMETMGIGEEELNNQMAMNVAMFKLVLSGGKGSVQAYNSITELLGDKDEKKKELENRKLRQEIEILKLEKEKLLKELGQGKDTYEDLTPLADLLTKKGSD